MFASKLRKIVLPKEAKQEQAPSSSGRVIGRKTLGKVRLKVDMRNFYAFRSC